MRKLITLEESKDMVFRGHITSDFSNCMVLLFGTDCFAVIGIDRGYETCNDKVSESSDFDPIDFGKAGIPEIYSQEEYDNFKLI